VLKWAFIALLLVQAHFAASFLVPLDDESKRTFRGLLRWLWPWAEGDSGLGGEITAADGVPFVGLILAMAAGLAFVIAALAVAGWWVPAVWWRPLAAAGAALLFVLMTLFFGPTKVLPMALVAVTLYVVLVRQDLVPVAR
jgi:hypothetical protein